jgi:predicted dehydrogenase
MSGDFPLGQINSNGGPFRVGIVGAGIAGATLHLPVLSAMQDFSVEWLCDLDGAKARSVADRHSIPRSFEDMNECSEVDAVVLTIPVSVRADALDIVFRRGWNVLVEKPFAKSIVSHVEILQKAQQAGVQIGVMAQRRGYHGTIVARRILRSRVLGSIKRIWAADSDGSQRSGIDGDAWASRIIDPATATGGFLEETGWHLIDNAFFLSDATAVEVRNAKIDDIDGIDTDIRALGVVTNDFGDTFEFAVRLLRSRDIKRGMRIECENGILEVGNYPTSPVILKSTEDKLICNLDVNIRSAKSGFAAVSHHWLAFKQQCESGQTTSSSADQAVLTTEFIETVLTHGEREI